MAHPDPRTLRAFLAAATEALEHRHPVARWTAWQRSAGLVGVALMAGCGAQSTSGGECTSDDCAEVCSDRVDNDADGAVDCEDTDCLDATVCLDQGTGGAGTGGMPPMGGQLLYMAPVDFEYDCADEVDNDRDGLTDCDDPDCTCSSSGGAGGSDAGGTGGVETGGSGGLGFGGTLYGIPLGGTGGAQTGGTGNESGGMPSLGGAPAYGIPAVEYACDDQFDNDFDGLVDCEDSDCVCNTGGVSATGGRPGIGGMRYGIPMGGTTTTGGQTGTGSIPGLGGDMPDYAVPFEFDCFDGFDDDYDGLVDCDDPDCDCEAAGGAGGAGGAEPDPSGGRYAIPF